MLWLLCTIVENLIIGQIENNTDYAGYRKIMDTRQAHSSKTADGLGVYFKWLIRVICVIR
jgi:hypothetical protein